MLLPITWLKDYVDINMSNEELAAKLMATGFEVEDIIYTGSEISNVVVGRINKIEQHPNADKLVVCQIDIGNKVLQIVTGATNVNEGNLVPVCLDGATLPGGKTIRTGELRGVKSEGMMCSGTELEITDAHYPGASVNGILILKEGTKLGQDIKEIVGLNECILDVNVLPNRPDCQSILGLAKEVAVAIGAEYKAPKFDYIVKPNTPITKLTVDVQNKELCKRYMAHEVDNIKIEESPDWMKKRLLLSNIRPINNIVDITNFVLLEVGQPMHAFDARDLKDEKIIVRCAKKGEKIITLDEKEHNLDEEVLVICDSEKPVALAGVMGGLNSGIKHDTTNIIFESARFARDNVRKTSKKLNQRSDSSARFEKGVDFNSCEVGLNRALHLIEELNCGDIVGTTFDEVNKEDLKTRFIDTEVNRVEFVLGLKIPENNILKILNSLGINSEIKNGIIHSEIPLNREDMENDADVIEEIIRVYGYDKIQPTLLKDASIVKGGKSEHQRIIDKIKNGLVADGFMEMTTYSFISDKALDKLLIEKDNPLRKEIKLLNPIGEETSTMRTQLVHSALSMVSSNLQKRNTEGRLFEIANVYLPKELPLKDLPDEREHLIMTVFGNEDFYTLKGYIENILLDLGAKFDFKLEEIPSYLHPGISAAILIDGISVGHFGQIHPLVAQNYSLNKTVYIAVLDIKDLLAKSNFNKKVKNLPKFPAISRDLAFVVDEDITVQMLNDEILRICGGLCEEVQLFDIYRNDSLGNNKKSMAYSIVFRSEDRTLVDSEVDELIEKTIETLKTKYNAQLRS